MLLKGTVEAFFQGLPMRLSIACEGSISFFFELVRQSTSKKHSLFPHFFWILGKIDGKYREIGKNLVNYAPS